MESEIISKAYKLKEELLKSECIQAVREAEKKMLDSDEVGLLIMKFQGLQNDLNEAVRFKLPTEKISKELSVAKSNLYTNALVKDYLDKLKIANAYLEEISDYIAGSIYQLKRSEKLCGL